MARFGRVLTAMVTLLTPLSLATIARFTRGFRIGGVLLPGRAIGGLTLLTGLTLVGTVALLHPLLAGLPIAGLLIAFGRVRLLVTALTGFLLAVLDLGPRRLIAWASLLLGL